MKTLVPNKVGFWMRSDIDNPVTVTLECDGLNYYADGEYLKVTDDGFWHGECVVLNEGDVVLNNLESGRILSLLSVLKTILYEELNPKYQIDEVDKYIKILEGK